jgi:hypothetical protein
MSGRRSGLAGLGLARWREEGCSYSRLSGALLIGLRMGGPTDALPRSRSLIQSKRAHSDFSPRTRDSVPVPGIEARSEFLDTGRL